MDPHSSIIVAPLNIVKSAGSHKHSPTSQSNGSLSAARFQMTPPLTPMEAQEAIRQATPPPSATFQSYLRAFYPFQPSTTLSPSSVTLALKAGDIILLHSIHTNGWADGTLLETGARGWLPTNYCEPYEFVPMRPLLRALTDFWDVIQSGSDSSLDVFRNQDYMRGLIAGVRFLLEKTDCLTRDSPLVRKHDNVRRTRKALLADLSVLVKVAKRLQDLTTGVTADESLDDILDEMLLEAFRIVTRGVAFLDIWNEEVGFDSAAVTLGMRHPANRDKALPFTPPAESHDAFATSKSTTTTTPPIGKDARPSPGARQSGPRTIADRTRSPTIASPQSSVGMALSPTLSRPMSTQSKRVSVTHRMSYRGWTAGAQNPNLASDRLSRCYDAFLGVLATFLGSHMQSRSSSELLLATQQAVKSCRELLAVIEAVLDNDQRRSESLSEAKDGMYDRITELVNAAREVFRPIHSSEEDMIFLPEEGKRLVLAATSCVQCAGVCIAKTRQVLEQTGDFELPPLPLRSPALADGPGASLPSSSPILGQSERAPSMPAVQDRAAPTTTPAVPHLDIPDIKAATPSTYYSSTSATSTQSSAGFFTPVSPALDRIKALPKSPPIPEAPVADSPEMQLRRQKSLARTVINSTGSDSTYLSSANESRRSMASASSRATSPDDSSQYLAPSRAHDGFSGSQTTLGDDVDDTEAKLLEKTFAHELMLNKDGQVVGGSLAALVEKLTAHDSTPDALFVSTFYLTFRLFASPPQFVRALIDRYQYVSDSPRMGGPVRLRVYNVFKGWLESHWRHDCDDVALPPIIEFATTTLSPALPTAGKRLTELAEKVALVHGPLVPRLISSMGKTNTATGSYFHPDTPLPPPVMSKHQLAALRTWRMGGANVGILDFDPLELARQITLKEASIFCSILPEELLATEWMKRSGSLAVNVRAMSTLSTDLANLVVDSILELEEPKKRAVVIKHWIKISSKCLDLNNYDTVMAIVCSLNSSTIARLRKTWEVVSQKAKTTLEELSKIVDVSRNYAVLRQRLQGHVAPCLPYVGMYLTDLVMVDHGNQKTRQLTGDEVSMEVINYDKHMKTAKIISELQRFQIPYRFTEVPELQTWMQDQLVRVRSAGEKSFQNYYRRSLLLEPREQGQPRPSAAPNASKPDKDRFDFLGWAHTSKDKSILSQG